MEPFAERTGQQSLPPLSKALVVPDDLALLDRRNPLRYIDVVPVQCVVAVVQRMESSGHVTFTRHVCTVVGVEGKLCT
jgi:hypothetical protein